MEGARSLLSDRLEAAKTHLQAHESPPAPPIPPERVRSPLTLLPERVRSPLTLHMDSATSHLTSVAESFKTHFPQGSDETKSLLLQGLEGTMSLLAARGMEGTKAMYPLAMDSLRAFLPYGGECVNSYLQERLDSSLKGVRERKDSCTPDSPGDAKRVLEHHREHRTHRKVAHSPKSQLSNPRHDAHLVHAIRELHEEEFGLDAVLLAEGGHVGAHCAVLAAASPFLKSLLLHANDHPAIISVTGTSLSTLQALVTCLYTGNIPAGTSLYHLAEAAKLLKMDELSAVLQKTFIAQGGSVLELTRPLPALRSALYGSQGLALPLEPRTEKSGKKIRSNRLDQILYQKLNVNHLAPADIPEPCPVPPPDSSRVPVLESPRVPPPDHCGGILGELLTKSDPLRSVFSSGGYSIADLGFDSSCTPLKPLNLSKPNKNQSSSTSEMSCQTTSYTSSTNSSTSTTTSCNTSVSSLASSLASQTDFGVSCATSLASTLPGSMTGLLPALTPSSIMSPSALASLTSSSALASLGTQHSASSAPSKSKSSSNSGSSRSRSGSKSGSSGRSSNSCRLSSSRNSSQHSLPLLYTLNSGIMTPEVANEVCEQLKRNPQLASLPGFDSLHNLSNLSSSASLQSLANLHNLSSLQSFPTLFPFLAPPSPESPLVGNQGSLSGSKDCHMSPGAPTSDPSLAAGTTSTEVPNVMSPALMPSEDQVALNLSNSALTSQSESPKSTQTEEFSTSMLAPSNSATQTSNDTSAGVEESDEAAHTVHPPPTEISTSCQTLLSQNSPDSALDADQNENSNTPTTNSSVACNMSHTSSNTIISGNMDPSSLPLLLMSSGASLAGMTQSQTDLPTVTDLSMDTHCTTQQEPSVLSPEVIDCTDDNGIEVIEEIPPGINRNQVHARKTLYHSGHMGRKRKGCGECEGCQVVEDCGQCRFCRDKAKFGGPNRLKQVCVYKRCVLAEIEPEDAKKRRKTSGKKGRGKCGGCDGCQRTSDCNECYACLHNAAAQPPARRKVCEMRVCEQQQMEEVRAALSVAGEPSPYSTDSLMAETMGILSGTSSPTPDGQPSTHNDKMKLMRKMLKKKFAQPYSRVRTKYYCGECPGCQTTTPCGNCLYCEDMPKFGGPGRYRQKCVKQLCVYHPRLQALKLSNRSKLTYDEQHISHETLSHLGAALTCAAEEAIDLGCGDSRENLEELESLEPVDEADDITEGEDSNATIHVVNSMEEVRLVNRERQKYKVDCAPVTTDVCNEMVNILPAAIDIISSSNVNTCTAITKAASAISTSASTSTLNLTPVCTPITLKVAAPSPIPSQTIIPSSVPTTIVDNIRPFRTTVVETTKPLDGARPLPTTVLDGARPLPTPVLDGARPLPTPVLDGARPLPTTVLDGARALPTPVLDGTRPLPTPVLDGARPLPTPVLDGARPLPTPVLDATRPLPTTVLDAARPLPTPVLDGARALPTPVLDGARLLPMPVLDGARALPMPVLDGTRPLPTPVLDGTRPLPTPVLDGARPLPTPVLDVTRPLPTPVLDVTRPLPIPIRDTDRLMSSVDVDTIRSMPKSSDTTRSLPAPALDTTRVIPARVADTIGSMPPADFDAISSVANKTLDTTKSLPTPTLETTKPLLIPTLDITKPLSTSIVDNTKPLPTSVGDNTKPLPTSVIDTTRPLPSPTPDPEVTEITENISDVVEGDLDDEVDNGDDEEEVISDASDVLSPPSTPSPRPRLRGRGRYRGQSRSKGKIAKTESVSIKRGKRTLRRGRRRRTPRFNLEPDDNSDYDDQFMLEGETPSKELFAEDKGSTTITLKSRQTSRAKVNDKIDNEGFIGNENPINDEDDDIFANVSKVEKLTIEPDIFEFQDSQETVIDNKGETRDSVMMKHSGPYVFQDEELSQGGRDVNENVGTVGETASA
ncbi:mucin-2 isoform X2 [Procambarus clarkii]|uniref:mucin-2 isoform X2 n=1 Tax=Procambarus clarkii TaxID=6728 RepID=UPI003742BD8A